ncbi:AAA domain-containing protein, partial [Cytidiella melzeri]
KDFCVITPYDAQRSAIVKALISANLPSDRVFNVDSFQGHEAEYVIISATRTARPGFLSLQSRTNVMLTRCRAGMIIVSNAFFASSRAEHTLFGKLAAYWEDVKPHDTIWIDWRRVLERTVDLPGAAGQQALLRTSRSLHASTSPSRTQITVKPGTSSLSTVPHLPSDYVSPAVPESHTSIESLQQRMSRLRVVTSSSARYARVDDPDFPEIPNLEPPAKQPALQGQWGKGSKSIKHR